MDQQKADRSSELPQGHQSPRGQVSPVNQLGDSQAAIKQAAASLREEGGLLDAVAAAISLLTSLAFHLPFFHEAQLFRNFRKKGGEEMSGTTTGLDWIQKIVVLFSVLLFMSYQA